MQSPQRRALIEPIMKLHLFKRKLFYTLATLSMLAVSFLFVPSAHAESFIGDVADFAPSSNWYTWFIRSGNETGHGQKFITAGDTEAIQTVGFKLCRLGTLAKPKTLTLCNSATNGWYAGCSAPIASKEFTADELNEMINYDADCNANLEGGQNDGTYYKWAYFSFDEPVAVSSNQHYFILLNNASSADNESGSKLRTMYNNENYLGSSADYTSGQAYYYKGATRFTSGASTDIFFKIFSSDPITIPFEITSPSSSQQIVNDTWVTVTGTCPINGDNRIGFTNDCLGFEEIEYTTSCVENTFSAEFYKSSLSERIIARDIESVSGDCVDYDDLMDMVTVDGIEFVDGYPEDWYFNFGLYDDYNIQIKSPKFDTALSLPKGSTSRDFTFSFTYPEGTIDDLTFNIKQYNSSGTELDSAFHTRTLASMTDTSNYTVTLSASTTPYHYVVQLIEDSTLKRQYPFGIYVSDLDFVGNPDDDDGYFFPRIVSELRKKIVFNYYFSFHDGFYNMFNGQYSSPSPTALDITFKSVSGNGQYNLDVKVFSASDPRVKAFASGLRPYIVALLWLGFALYVVFRVTHLFSDNQ
jgi:hypothetical protein